MDRVNDKTDTIHCVPKNFDSGIETGNITSGHSGHSSFLNKLHIKGIIKEKKEEREKNIYRENNRIFTVSTVSKPENLDPRFNSQKFRTAVRIVLNYFGYQTPTFADFKKVEAMFNGRIDWLTFSRNISQPHHLARVKILDQIGFPICEIAKRLLGSTRTDALENLNTKRYRFEKWLW